MRGTVKLKTAGQGKKHSKFDLVGIMLCKAIMIKLVIEF